jgi:hypothetical protein
MPGQRALIMASPGFIVPFDDQQQITDLIGNAIRANIVISALDARGLWTPPMFDASREGPAGGSNTGYISAMIGTFLTQEQSAQSDVLEEVSHGTGGSLFQNNNDLKAGFEELSVAPEYIYVLGFNPAALKFDGKFHNLKVSLGVKDMTVQARKGYYAPKREVAAADQAKEEIQDAVFSREIMRDIPMTLHTQFFKTGDYDAKLSVVSQVDVKALRFHKEDGRNRNDLTMVAALFDLNGNFVKAIQKKVELRLKDDTLQTKLGSGITLKTAFDVKTGGYVVRVVVRDSEGELMAAQNSSVQIP